MFCRVYLERFAVELFCKLFQSIDDGNTGQFCQVDSGQLRIKQLIFLAVIFTAPNVNSNHSQPTILVSSYHGSSALSFFGGNSMNYVPCLFEKVQNIPFSGQSELFDFLKNSFLYFILWFRVPKYRKIWCFLFFFCNATAELNKLTVFNSFPQL